MDPTPTLQFIDSGPLLGDHLSLCTRADREGYLFFKNLLPKEDVLQVRADILSIVEQHGWRRKGQDEYGGLIDGDALNQVPDNQMRLDVGVNSTAYDDVQKLENMHRLPHHPNLYALYQTLFGRDVLAHPRHIARLVTSHQAMIPTPQHQDFPLIQGATNTWTCWIPLGNCPREMGGLTVLRGSHSLGKLPIQEAKGAGNISAQLCPGENEWVEGDFEIGDVLTFPSLTVHKALPTCHKEQIRLSLDVRYQPLDDPIEAKSLLPHCSLTWEEIYARWERDDLKYYWQTLPLDLLAWDDTLQQPKRRIC